MTSTHSSWCYELTLIVADMELCDTTQQADFIGLGNQCHVTLHHEACRPCRLLHSCEQRTLFLSCSTGRQNTFKTEIQREKEQGIYWDTLVKGGRNQYLEKMSLINDLHPFGVPNSGLLHCLLPQIYAIQIFLYFSQFQLFTVLTWNLSLWQCCVYLHCRSVLSFN